jgi:hypothetical protein
VNLCVPVLTGAAASLVAHPNMKSIDFRVCFKPHMDCGTFGVVIASGTDENGDRTCDFGPFVHVPEAYLVLPLLWAAHEG